MLSTPALLAAGALVAAGLVASGCGSGADPAGTTGAASPGVQRSAAGAGDGPDLSLPPRVARDSAPPLVRETDEQLAAAAERQSTFPTVLDPRLWNGEDMKADVAARTVANVNALAKRSGITDLTVDAIELFGSNASYEYDDKADFGVHVFVSSPTMDPDRVDRVMKLLSSYAELKQEGSILYYGVPLEVTFHGKRTGNYTPKPGQGQYSFTEGKWIEKPTQQPNRFDRAQMVTDAKGYIATYNALAQEYANDKKAFDCDRFGDLDDEMKKYRGAGLDAGGQRSTANLTYRMLRRLSVNIPDQVDVLEDECNFIRESLP